MAKESYRLLHNESIIMRNEHVYRGNEGGELILTNLHLVYTVLKGVFMNKSVIRVFPLNQIKVINGKAQALLGKRGGIDIYFVNGQESFTFLSGEVLLNKKKAEKEAIKWVNAICQLIAGEEVDTGGTVTTASLGVEMVADALGNTIGTFKNALGMKTKNTPIEKSNRIVKKCSFCGASISGDKGQIVRCMYCDADQQL